jgi:hypothetical protein
MTTESMVLIAIGVIAGILLFRHMTRMMRKRNERPVSQQWLIDQRVRDEQ